MSKAGSLFTFLAGAAVGAAFVYLSCTDDGRKIAKKGKEKALDCADDILEKIEEKRNAAKSNTESEVE